MKAIILDELDKYIRTNKITVYDIYVESRKLPLYSSRDEMNVEDTIQKALETFESMPSGIYKFKGKPSNSSPNNTWNETDVQVGSFANTSRNNVLPSNSLKMFTQEELDKAVQNALERKQKEDDLKECRKMFEVLDKRLSGLEEDFDELLDLLDLDAIRGSKTDVSKMVQNAASSAIEHGTKTVIDRFAKHKNS